MSAIVTNKFRHSNAKNFYDSFGTDKYYLFVGRSESWANDNSPPVPVDSVVSETEQYRDMIAAKNVSTPDVTYVIPRRNWVTATVYDMYHHNVSVGAPASSGATNLWDSTFYVMNQNYNVYICISNNGGVVSTAEPTGTSTNIITTGDGYKWKYLYTISTSEVQKYLSLDFMPVIENSTVSSASTAGSIEFVKLVNGGSGYVDNTYTAVPIHGDGTAGTVDVVIAGGIVTTVTINAVGSGYTFASIDLTTYEDSNVTTTVASIDPIISPVSGHGSDNKKELGAFFVMINTTLAGAEGAGDFLVNQDFRQVGLLKNPTESGVAASSSTLSCLKSLTVTGFGSTDFVIDEVITGSVSSAIGIVSDFNSTTGVLKYFQQSETGNGLAVDGDIDVFTTSDTVTGATSTASGTVTVVSQPEIDVYSGDIIYIENRMPIPRATDQQENIKLIVEF
jgi:hypothetical protein